MAFKYSVKTELVCELSSEDQLPHQRLTKKYRKTLREVKRNGQTRRVPVNMDGEVVGEHNLFHALKEAGFGWIKVICLHQGAREPAVKAAIKLSANYPICEHNEPRAVKDALKMIKHGIRPSDELGFYLQPLIECFAE